MVTDVLDGEFVEQRPRLSRRVGDQAAAAPSGSSVLDLLVLPFYVIGMAAFWMLVILGGVARYSWAGVRLGWLEARDTAQARRIAVDRWPVRRKRPKPEPSGGTR